jgi:hypothetical protein
LDLAFCVSHADQAFRDSFVLDVLEGLRPKELVLDLTKARAFAKRDFAEFASGELRVNAPLRHEFVELLMPRLARIAAPLVEHLASMFADASPTQVRVSNPLTRTSRRRAGQAS